MAFFPQVPLRIPVKLVDGKWEFFYGGAVPVRNGAIGDLILEKDDITNAAFLSLLNKRSVHKILDEGTELLVALTVHNESSPAPEFLKLLKTGKDLEGKLGADYFHTPRPGKTRFASIWVGPPTDRQKKKEPKESGGVWLELAGTQPKGVSSSQILVSKLVSEEPLQSLNHAFTRLSEVYEPWRLSHTGSIYQRILYLEKNQKWYPLSVLRNASAAKDEHELIKQQWAVLATILGISQK